MKQKTIETIVNICRFTELDPEIQVLITKAKEQTKNCYVPYSKFHVGAALLLENGALFLGSNQENAAYPAGICAERVALSYANTEYPDVPVKAVAIAAYVHHAFTTQPISPCGICRQTLLEAERRFKSPIDIYMYGAEYIYHISSAENLLPVAFSLDKNEA
jgi:cytidine deaminase